MNSKISQSNEMNFVNVTTIKNLFERSGKWHHFMRKSQSREHFRGFSNIKDGAFYVNIPKTFILLHFFLIKL